MPPSGLAILLGAGPNTASGIARILASPSHGNLAVALLSRTGDPSLASTMSRRAASWEYEFNPATGYVQARGADGSFPPGAAFEGSQLEPGGQLGFEEGNARAPRHVPLLGIPPVKLGERVVHDARAAVEVLALRFLSDFR